jgi:hypothetical protein
MVTNIKSIPEGQKKHEYTDMVQVREPQYSIEPARIKRIWGSTNSQPNTKYMYVKYAGTGKSKQNIKKQKFDGFSTLYTIQATAIAFYKRRL